MAQADVPEVLKFGEFIREYEPIEIYRYLDRVYYYHKIDKEFVWTTSAEAYKDLGLRDISYEIIYPHIEKYRRDKMRIGGIRGGIKWER